VREREDANRTREAGGLDEIHGVVAIRLKLLRDGAVGFIDWLDVWAATLKTSLHMLESLLRALPLIRQSENAATESRKPMRRL
jgi:hypothetical protein